MGECPRYQMMEPLRDHNVNVLMNTSKIGFKDTSGFGRACTTMGEEWGRGYQAWWIRHWVQGRKYVLRLAVTLDGLKSPPRKSR